MKKNSEKIKVIITGATGMVGEGVLHECLQHPAVEEVLIVSRKPYGLSHPKLKEVIHTDFFNLSSIEDQLTGYNACLFCLGVSSAGMKEKEYYHMTYGLTMHFAETLSKKNTNMTFCYISGAGTDSTEKGKLMWARVKGKTENDLRKLSFKNVYNFRPGVIQPTKGLKNTLSLYNYLGWLLPLIRLVAPKYICSLKDLGTAMINASLIGYKTSVLEVSDILELAKKEQDI
jgi:hypothetical protein